MESDWGTGNREDSTMTPKKYCENPKNGAIHRPICANVDSFTWYFCGRRRSEHGATSMSHMVVQREDFFKAGLPELWGRGRTVSWNTTRAMT